MAEPLTDRFRDDLERLRRELGQEQPTLAGYSWGATYRFYEAMRRFLTASA